MQAVVAVVAQLALVAIHQAVQVAVEPETTEPLQQQEPQARLIQAVAAVVAVTHQKQTAAQVEMAVQVS
jgi:hypothetical protein